MKLITLAALLFLSGFCALVYQATWFREFRLVFGSSTMASASVLAIFMAGLGFGSLLLGRRAEASARPIRFYGILELLITLSVALSPFLLDLVRSLYIGMGGSTALGAPGATVVRLLLSCVVIGLPTFLMGGTLPALAKSASEQSDPNRRSVSLLYGFNTLGAVCGVVLANFYLFESFGNRTSLWMACGLNLLVVVFSRACDRTFSSGETATPPPIRPVRAVSPKWMILIAAGVVGFAFMLMELVWYRMLSPILGGSSFTFGLVLATALLGIGLGGLLYSALFSKVRPSMSLFAATCAFEALLIAIPFALGDKIAELTWLLQGVSVFGFPGSVAVWFVVAGTVVFLPSIVAGVQFPLLIGLMGEGENEVALDTSKVYVANTLGSICGSLVGGFGILPLLSATGAWRAVVLLLATLSILWVLRHWRAIPFGVAVVAIGIVTLLSGPSAIWRHSGIGAGRAGKFPTTTNEMLSQRNSCNAEILWEKDGVESGVGISNSNGLGFIVNGKADGNLFADAGTQIMVGMIPAILHPNPRRACVIGLGTGSSAGWLGAIPEMERVDVVELEPAIAQFAADCALGNQAVMENPKVTLHFGDGREWLLTTKESYDLISSEPSNPYRAGIASLFTQEFYRAVKGKLKRGGIFLQWVQAYEIDAQALLSVCATLRSEFKHVECWQSQGTDLVFLASNEPIPHDYDHMRETIAAEPFRSALAFTWNTNTVEGVYARFIGDDRLTKKLADAAGGEINTDDKTTLEYALGRSVGRDLANRVSELAQLSLAMDNHLPPGIREKLDIPNLDRNTVLVNSTADPKEAGNRVRNFTSFVASLKTQTPEAALKFWKENPWTATDISQSLLLARAAAFSGAPESDGLIGEIGLYLPAEALMLRTIAASKSDSKDQAKSLAVEAIKKLQVDMWGAPLTIRTFFDTLIFLSKDDREFAKLMSDSLDRPFAGFREFVSQKYFRMLLARLSDEDPLNQRTLKAVEAMEPHVPWVKIVLSTRAGCYLKYAHPQKDKALADWAEFQSHTDQSVGEIMKKETN